MAFPVINPFFQFFDNAGEPLDGGTVESFIAGTSTPQVTYQNAGLSIQNELAIDLDSAGRAAIFPADGVSYKFIVKDANGVTLATHDAISSPLAGTQAAIVALLYPRTAAEISAAITPTNYAVPSHEFTQGVIPNRYLANTTPGTTNMTNGFTSAKAVAQAASAPILLLPEDYLAAVSLRYNGAAIIGPGSALCSIKQPPGTLTAGGVVEVGDTASGGGGAAYVGFVAHGFTIDGNAANTTAPAGDVTGHGIIMTDITRWSITDVVAKDCHLAGIIPVIRSNYGHIEAKVINCGHGGSTWPGFDINSSQHITGSVVSIDCYSGARILDNCFGINMDFTIENPDTIGFLYNNQSVNECHSNIFRVTVDEAGTDGGQVGGDCRNSIIQFTSNAATNYGFRVVRQATSTDRQNGNQYIVSTRNSGGASCEVGGDGDIWTICSDTDGLTGAAGSFYAVEVSGQRNLITANVTTDPSTPQIRGITVTANAVDTAILGFTANTLVSYLADLGTRTFWTRAGGGDAIASAGTINIPTFGDVFHVTGTTGITSITATSCNGRRITLIFDGVLTVTDGSNLKLAGNYTTTADDTMTLWCDATNWYEIARSVN